MILQAEEITLTIGQAFELAYKKFLDTSGKELETQKNLMTLQKRIEILENENTQLKSRLRDVAKIKGEADVQEYIARNKVRFKFLNIPYFHSTNEPHYTVY